MDLIFFGMQGSGKGTLGKAIAERYGMRIFEMGGELRKLSSEDSDLGHEVKSTIESGKLVSTELVVEIVNNFLNNLKPGASVLFDGIPRKPDQAHYLNDLLNKHSREYRAVLLKIKEETAIKRLSTRRICENCKAVYPADYQKDSCETCGGKLITRADDVPEAIISRLKAFSAETIPAMNLYTDLIKIDGEPTIDEVRVLAFEKLDPLMKK